MEPQTDTSIPPTSESRPIDKLAAALAKAQGVMEPAPKDSKNPFFNSHYADLASVWNAIRKPLADNELSVIQLVLPAAMTSDGSTMILQTILAHSSGQSIASNYPITPLPTRTSKEDATLRITPQSVGSAITYARRYALSALVGVCSEVDDDGNGASALPPKEPSNPNSRSSQFYNQPKPSAKDSKPVDFKNKLVADVTLKVAEAGGKTVEAGGNINVWALIVAIAKDLGKSAVNAEDAAEIVAATKAWDLTTGEKLSREAMVEDDGI